jgi:murein DD-endopeptidase MepM/ murein hydrolase activator NlpD
LFDSDFVVEESKAKLYFDGAAASGNQEEVLALGNDQKELVISVFEADIPQAKRANFTAPGNMDDFKYPDFESLLTSYGEVLKEESKEIKKIQTFADAIASGRKEQLTYDNWINDDTEKAKAFVKWLKSREDEEKTTYTKHIGHIAGIDESNIDLNDNDQKEKIKRVFEGGTYEIKSGQGVQSKETLELEPPAGEGYLETGEAQELYGYEWNPPEEKSGSAGQTSKAKKARVSKPSSLTIDAKEKQAEVDYGYVGTFLRASVAITSKGKVAVTKEDEEAAKKGIEESRIRRAIRKMLIKEQEGDIEQPRIEPEEEAAAESAVVGDEADEAEEVTDEEILNKSVEEIKKSPKLVDRLINMVSQSNVFGNTVWAIFSKFSNPNQPLYAICIGPESSDFYETSFNKAGISMLGKTNQEIIGKAREFVPTDRSVLEFAIERVILKAIETSEEYGPAEAQLKTGNLDSNTFDADSSGIGPINYQRFAQLFRDRKFNDTEFVENMTLIKDYMTDSNKLYDIMMVDTNAKGVLQTDTKSIMKNAKVSDPIAYKNAIDIFNSSLSDTLRPGEKVTFQIVKKKGVSKNFVFRSDNKKHERALNANAASFTNALSNFLGESGLASLQGSGGPNVTAGKNRLPLVPKVGKSVTIPAEASYYTVNIDGKRSNNENIGMKVDDLRGLGAVTLPLGFYVLPMLNEKQFYAVLLNYWTKNAKTRSAVRDEVKKNLSNVKQSYVTYKSNYRRFVERKVFKLFNDKRMTKELRDFKLQYQDVLRGDYSSIRNSPYFYFSSSDVIASLPGGARRLRRRERDTTETLERKTSMYYIHKPGVMVDPYDDFIRKIIINCTNANSAAENVQGETVKIYENIFNRHQLLYKIYLKNKLKENVKTLLENKKKQKIKKKIKSLIIERYKAGDTMLGSFAAAISSSGDDDASKDNTSGRDDRDKEEGEKEKPGDGKKPDLGVSSEDGHNHPAGTDDAITQGNSKTISQATFTENVVEQEIFSNSEAPVSNNVNSLPWFKRMYTRTKGGKKYTSTGQHGGIDYAAPSGTDVAASDDGVVIYAGWEKAEDHKFGGGLYVKIKHNDYTSLYMHLNSLGTGIQRNATVSAGDTIGKSGETGNATGPHLHYEVRTTDNKRNVLSQVNFLIQNKDNITFSGEAKKDLEIIEKWIDAGCKLKDNNAQNYFAVGDAVPNDLKRENYNWKEGYYQTTKFTPTNP